MIYEVEMNAFGNGQIRKVEIDDEAIEGMGLTEILELIFKFGQNDVQPQDMPSVSMGDVIRFKHFRYEVSMFGFEERA